MAMLLVYTPRARHCQILSGSAMRGPRRDDARCAMWAKAAEDPMDYKLGTQSCCRATPIKIAMENFSRAEIRDRRCSLWARDARIVIHCRALGGANKGVPHESQK